MNVMTPELPYSAGLGDQREAADHLAVDDVVERAAGRRRALARQDLVVVAVERLAAADAITARACVGHGFAKRTWLLALPPSANTGRPSCRGG